MQKVQEEMVNLKVTGEAGAGMVKVTMNGRHDVAGVEVDPDLLKEPVIVLQDLMAAAINDAVQKVEEHNKDKSLGLPMALVTCRLISVKCFRSDEDQPAL